MNNNVTSLSMKKDSGRVLFTGCGTNIIESVTGIVGKKFNVYKCRPLESELMLTLDKVKPHVIVICLQNETSEMLYIYDALTTQGQYLNIPVIIVGYKEDCAQFANKVPVKYLETFIRPLDSNIFMSNLKKWISQSRLELNWACDREEISEPGSNHIHNPLESEKALIRKVQRLTLKNGRKSILVVDDDVRMLNVLKMYLEELYDVTVVPSGKLALKYITKKSTDLILLDYMMPEMDGPDVLKEIRENSSLPDVPVVFLTGVADKEFVMRGLALKPSGYLLKPISREDLIERVTEILLDI